MFARNAAAAIVFLAIAASWDFGGETPKVTLQGWKETLEANPKFFEVGVHLIEKPERAFVVTGKVSRKNLSLKTLDERQAAANIAELAAKKQLLNYMFEVDKAKLKLPRELEKLATDSLKFDAHSRSLTMKGVQVAARWTDDSNIWCTLLISQSNVQRVKEFADSFRSVGASHYLAKFSETEKDADLYRAFEIGGQEMLEVREAISQRFLAQGFRVAAFIVSSPKAHLPRPDEPLAVFLAKSKCKSWEDALEHYQTEKPDLEKALDGFLLALETRYGDPDALNYVGVCFRELGFPRMGSVFLEHSLAQSPKQGHRYALTNLGLCHMEMDQPEDARKYLEKAVEVFPKESWTDRAREALRKLDAEKK